MNKVVCWFLVLLGKIFYMGWFLLFLGNEFGLHFLGKMKRLSLKKGMRMCGFLVTKIILVAREGFWFHHMKNSGRGVFMSLFYHHLSVCNSKSLLTSALIFFVLYLRYKSMDPRHRHHYEVIQEVPISHYLILSELISVCSA